ncbi:MULTISPECIES: carboxylesterase [unclassified Oceanispirochaeta]|uniref:alpha/beta hydrolase n=1 Tax=unclassified Oceanispirochaeta TaxID=2635722 RepID=UPI000E097770|nr:MULTISPECIES: alpha/beta fold hydrolase [unclassified Oceanispirochaeta]MBF9018424.1 alpha/beta fold hydrolase [Oceanispirochaeta sp. M2]NPD74855.1 alpha/beta fold hydrolase [Oceanispirochaeta sp. M1]RDG29296.1 alpha/beta fold hydrolase [Oceanispirochaeta sp. M1]
MTPTEFKLRDTKVRRCARPRILGDGKDAVLGLHGFMGYPGELSYPAEKLAEAGFTVSLPRFPGHGTCGEDFNQSSGGQWLRAAIDAYLELKSNHEKIHVMGHSMGGVLAILLASIFPVEKMVLMAPAVKLSGPLFLTEPLSLFVNKALNRPQWEADNSVYFLDDRDEDDDLYMGQEYWTWSYFRRLADLSRLRRQSLRQLPLVKADILSIIGRNDPTVPLKAADVIKKRAGGNVESVILENSAHLVPYDKDYEKNAELTVSWMR